MALETYGDLKTALANWLHRDDLGMHIPDFIRLCESDMKHRLKTVDLQKRQTITLNSAYVALPDDFRALRRITLLEAADFIHGRLLRALSPAAIPADGQRGIPHSYALTGMEMQLYPAPDKAMQAEILYQASLIPLVHDGDSNVILRDHPDCYLFGALKEAFDFLRDENGMMKMVARYEAALDKVMADSRARRVGATPALQAERWA